MGCPYCGRRSRRTDVRDPSWQAGPKGACSRTRVESQEIRLGPPFEVHLPQEKIGGQALVLACGGLSFPQLGASDFGYRVARQFGLGIVEPRPGLVPLTLEEGEIGGVGDLSG